MLKVLLDVRCLQDPNYARRGVGRHALALLRGARAGGAIGVFGLCDHALPALADEARAVLDGVWTDGYAAHLDLHTPRQPVAYVSLSPMTHDPLFAARLLGDESIRRVAVVYDFIPYRNPSRYLPGAADRLEYVIGLRWLAACDLFAAISRTSADDVVDLLRVDARRVCVTGAPIHPAFAELSASAARRDHILVVGGRDPRKNPELVIRAHAGSKALQAEGVRLVIAGAYSPEDVRSLNLIAEQAGGSIALIQYPEYRPLPEFLKLYANAKLVVVASSDEGFSLPVVESMAAGAVVLASDIPVHAELVPDARRRFPLGDELVLRRLLEQGWSDEEFRQEALAAQATVWPGFLEAAVAERFWSAVKDQPGPVRSFTAPAVSRQRRPKVAVLSPLPPDRSGVADYTAATCTALGSEVELHLFTETEQARAPEGVAGVRPLDATPCLRPSFDRVISVLGNSHFHLGIFRIFEDYGGAVIAHDARMLGFYRSQLGEARALETASTELGRSVSSKELDSWCSDERHLEALFLGDIARVASPMCVHSPVTAKLVERRHGITPVCLPFSIYRPWTTAHLMPASRAAARQRLGLTQGDIVIATFGYVHASKAPEECVWALEVLRRWGFPVSLHFVGGVEGMPDGGAHLSLLADSIQVGAHVSILGRYASERVYRDYLVAADLGIQLRTFGAGALSGALLDCAAAGLPTVANRGLSEAVGVPSYVRSIPDAISPLLLAEALADLIETGVTGGTVEAERRAFSAARSTTVYAQSLASALGLDLHFKSPMRE